MCAGNNKVRRISINFVLSIRKSADRKSFRNADEYYCTRLHDVLHTTRIHKSTTTILLYVSFRQEKVPLSKELNKVPLETCTCIISFN